MRNWTSSLAEAGPPHRALPTNLQEIRDSQSPETDAMGTLFPLSSTRSLLETRIGHSDYLQNKRCQASMNPASFSALRSKVAVARHPNRRLRALIRQSANSACESFHM
jgi:hypothetical protein